MSRPAPEATALGGNKYSNVHRGPMFVTAIEAAANYTRPLHIAMRTYNSVAPFPGAATIFLVNSDGWALTCKHVAQHLMATGPIITNYAQFKKELNAASGSTHFKRTRKQLEQKYKLDSTKVVQILNHFVGCVDASTKIECKLHPTLDLALIKFEGFKTVQATSFPTFAQNGAELKPGKSLCRLGYPFPEFTNFEYDKATDTLRWTTTGRATTPRFPIDGMVTRHLGDPAGNIVGFELSTPGLKGQSGGPAFSSDGTVWGMQASTKHLDLDFDVNQEVLRNGAKKRVTDSAFLHVGQCVHVDALKAFMTQYGVVFQQA